MLTNSTQTTVTNGLNQLSTVNGTSAAYDARGNMTTDPVTAKTYTYYGSNNQLWTVPSPFTAFSYDALDRLANFNTGAPVTNYVSDGSNIIAEYDGSNVLQKRYAFDGSGEPLVAYDASGNRTWMSADERGSIIALASDSGAMTGIDTYDEYGIPGAANQGTFQYAGMLWLSRAVLYAPTFRAYGALNGRFSQTDPIGMAGGVNLYAYVGGDPVNLVDLLGFDKAKTKLPEPPPPPPTGTRIPGGISPQLFGSVGGGTFGFPIKISTPTTCEGPNCETIVVTAPYYVWVPLFESTAVMWGIVTDAFNDIERRTQELTCQGLSILGNKRMALSADFQGYGGLGGAAGASASIDAQGNTYFNMYYGWGAGAGMVGGVGISLIANGPAPGVTPINHLQGGVGLGFVGFSGTYSKNEGGSGAGGASVGLRGGVAGGSVTGTSETTYGGNICR